MLPELELENVPSSSTILPAKEGVWVVPVDRTTIRFVNAGDWAGFSLDSPPGIIGRPYFNAASGELFFLTDVGLSFVASSKRELDEVLFLLHLLLLIFYYCVAGSANSQAIEHA